MGAAAWQDLFNPPTTMETISITIQGEPKAQKRHRSTNIGSFTRQYDPSASDKKDFLSLLQDQAPTEPINQPVALSLMFYFSRPKGHYGSGKNSGVLKPTAPVYHTSKPDVDNLTKFIMDALNKVYWRDDSLVAVCNITKHYSSKPRTEIIINTI